MTKFHQGHFEPTRPEKYVGKRRPIYRSSWELRLMEMCDNNPAVTAWASENDRIPYIHPFTGKATHYVPDFMICFTDETGRNHIEMIEVKPSSQSSLEEAKTAAQKEQAIINAVKWQAAAAWCDHHGIRFRVITEEDIFRTRKKRVRKARIPRARLKRKK